LVPLLLGLSGPGASAVLAAPPFEVDDPATVKRGSVEMFLYYGLRDTRKETAHSLPGTAISYGISDTTELSLSAAPILRADATLRWGVSDIQVKVKQRIWDEGRISPALSVSYQAIVGSGNDRLRSGAVNHHVLLIAGRRIWQGNVHVNLGASVHPEADHVASLLYGVGYVLPLSKRLSLGVEVLGQTSRMRGGGDDLSWGVAMLYEVAENRTLALRVGRAERGGDDVTLSMGVVFYFPN
jgi:hypothetical protein